MERNKTARELLEILRSLGETSRIEAKLCGAVSKSVMETVCAYANEPGMSGGQLLLGVDEEKDSLFPDYSVVGIRDIDKITNDLISQCRTRFNTGIIPQITPEKLEGKTVLNVFIPEAAPGSKPVYFKDDGLPAGALRRGSSGDVHCTEDDLSVLFEGRGSQSYDSSIVPNASWRDIDLSVVAEYRQERAKSTPDADEHEATDEELLYSLSCLEERDDKFLPTVAGVLLFGKKAAIRRLFPLMRVDYIPVAGLEWVADPSAQFSSIDMLDPLMRVVTRTLELTLQDVAAASVLPEGQARRQAVSTLPGRALREAIVNAVMHRSYQVQGATQVIRYANRIEIRNPGYSLKNAESWGATRSINRNPKIAAVMYDGRFAETKGRGMKVMQKTMEEAGLTSPFFESDRSDNSFTVTFLLHHFLTPQDVDWLAGFKEYELTNEEAKALIWVRETGGLEGAINVAVYKNLNQGDDLNAAGHLRRLQNVGILKKNGRGSQAYFKPGKIFADVHSQWLNRNTNKPPLFVQKGEANSPILDAKGEAVASSQPEEGSLKQWIEPGNAELTEGQTLIDALRAPLLNELAPELREEILAIGGKESPREMKKLILAICSTRYYQSAELGLLLNRRAEKLQEKYLSPLRKDGHLQWLHPEKPSSPLQAYGTTTSPQDK